VADNLFDRVVVAIGTQYLVDGEIGRGGSAVVYRGTDLKLGRQVAIKVLPPELAYNDSVRVRFVREAQTAAGLNHPNIVPIYSVDEREGIVYFVMGLVIGQSIGARVGVTSRAAPARAGPRRRRARPARCSLWRFPSRSYENLGERLASSVL